MTDDIIIQCMICKKYRVGDNDWRDNPPFEIIWEKVSSAYCPHCYIDAMEEIREMKK